MRYTTRPLDASTWAAFAELTARNNGVFGGCWCMGYHPEPSRTDAAQNRAGKERRVREGRAHAALVFDENGTAQGWCQYGGPEGRFLFSATVELSSRTASPASARLASTRGS
jgi:hypothetical protein